MIRLLSYGVDELLRTEHVLSITVKLEALQRFKHAGSIMVS